MTTFKEIRGTDILALSSDPSNPETGQIWYNSSSGTLKGYRLVGTWSSGGNLPVAKNSGASDGTSTAAWTAGGSSTPTGNTGMSQTDLYNGTSWTTSGNLNTARTGVAGFGTQTAAVAAGGYVQPGAGPTRTMYANTENFNGSAWTASGALPSGRSDGGACGIQTAGLYFGGGAGYGGPSLSSTAKYNGTTWTAVNSMNTAGSYTRAGTQTAALASISSTSGTGTESYNGTTWTVGTSRNIAGAQMAGFGLQTAAYLAGGYSAGPGAPQFSTTEYWNGTVWANTGSLATARRAGMGVGTQSGTAGLITGGTTPVPYITATESYTGLATQTITVS
jgi:hypothetical protein